MKKIFALLLAAMMVFSLVACSNSNNNNTEPSTEPSTEDTTPKGPVVIAPSVDAGTMGSTLWDAFVEALNQNPDANTETLANTLIGNPVIQFMGMAMPVEAGTEYFAGFDNYTITGFDSAASFGPMIGSIPFIGYVFQVSEGTDVNTFLSNLTGNCNPRWNICVEADQTVAGAVGNMVLFVMCPASSN